MLLLSQLSYLVSLLTLFIFWVMVYACHYCNHAKRKIKLTKVSYGPQNHEIALLTDAQNIV